MSFELILQLGVFLCIPYCMENVSPKESPKQNEAESVKLANPSDASRFRAQTLDLSLVNH